MNNNKAQIGVVISRWGQNIDWIEQITAPHDIFVYNRHADKTNIGNLNVERCLSKGMRLKIIDKEDDNGYESSTNAYHIWTNYHNLNDYTLFYQDRRDYGHCTDIVERLNNPEKLLHTTYIPNNQGPSLIEPTPVHTDLPIEFEYIADRFGYTDPSTDWGWFPYKDDYSKIPWFEFVKDMPGWKQDPDTGEWKAPFPVIFGMANAFIASRKRIQRHDAEYFKRLQNFCNTYIDPRFEESGRPSSHLYYYGSSITEPLWKYII